MLRTGSGKSAVREISLAVHARVANDASIFMQSINTQTHLNGPRFMIMACMHGFLKVLFYAGTYNLSYVTGFAKASFRT